MLRIGCFVCQTWCFFCVCINSTVNEERERERDTTEFMEIKVEQIMKRCYWLILKALKIVHNVFPWQKILLLFCLFFFFLFSSISGHFSARFMKFFMDLILFSNIIIHQFLFCIYRNQTNGYLFDNQFPIFKLIMLI